MSNRMKIKAHRRFQVQMQMENGDWADVAGMLLGSREEALHMAYTGKALYGGEWRVEPRVLRGGA